MEHDVNAEHIQKNYGKKEVLKDVCLSADRGAQIAIIGRNGTGKSTLLQILSGIQKPTHGTITYFQTPADTRKAFSRYCGYVPQDNPLFPELTIQDNISLWSGKRSCPDSQPAQLLELEEIWKVPVEKLSGGMKRRVSIACALVSNPKILLMDEPTSALDFYYKNSIHHFMKQYCASGGIILFTTHDREEAETADQCLVLEEGSLHKGTPSEWYTA